MFVQGNFRVFVCQQGGCLGGAVFANDADHDMAQLYLPGLDPRPGLLPKHIAVRTVGIAEQVDDFRRGLAAVGNPGGLFKLGPDFLRHRLVDQFLQRRLAQVLALGIVQAASQHMLAVGGQVQGNGLLAVFGGIAAQAVGSVESADDMCALGFQSLDRSGSLRRLESAGFAGR